MQKPYARICRLEIGALGGARIEDSPGTRYRRHSWVVMPDHLHWLCILRKGSLARLMQRVKSRSAIAVNRATFGNSEIWQPGYHDHALREDEDVKDVARYILANPVRAGLVAKIGDYPLWDAIWV